MGSSGLSREGTSNVKVPAAEDTAPVRGSPVCRLQTEVAGVQPLRGWGEWACGMLRCHPALIGASAVPAVLFVYLPLTSLP